jgi:hypothetical protein
VIYTSHMIITGDNDSIHVVGDLHVIHDWIHVMN